MSRLVPITAERARQLLDDAEQARRRERTEQGRSPAQQTTRSENKTRSTKYPGRGNRAAQERSAIEEES